MYVYDSILYKATAAIEELDAKKLWRVSFDNLNFKMKYSKDLIGDGGPKWALNLITGQVVHSKSHNINEHKNKIPSLRELSQNKLNKYKKQLQKLK